MKGTPDFPQCGFSGQAVAALKAVGKPFAYVNIFEDEEIREGLKTYSNWPTFPQLYVNGELKFEVRTHYMDFHTFDSIIGNDFQGWIDDFRISDHIIEPETMLQHYRANRLRDWERLREDNARMSR